MLCGQADRSSQGSTPLLILALTAHGRARCFVSRRDNGVDFASTLEQKTPMEHVVLCLLKGLGQRRRGRCKKESWQHLL